jgi:hypothetical protein
MIAGAVITPINVGYWIKALVFFNFAFRVFRFAFIKVNTLAFTAWHRVGLLGLVTSYKSSKNNYARLYILEQLNREPD